MAFDLGSIRRGPSIEPPRVVIFGPHGSGKTTWAAGAPSPIFILTEDGLGSIDTASFPLCESYSNVMDAIESLYTQSHDFQTVVLDSLDWMEPMIWRHVAKQHDKKDIEDFGYARGYTYAADQWRTVLAGLNALRTEKGMAVVLTAHSRVTRFDDPMSEPYDRYGLGLHKTAAAVVSEWADCIGFASERTRVQKTDVGFNKQARRAVSTGERVLHVSRTASYDAKNRYGITDSLPLEWAAFQAAVRGQ